MVFASFLAVPAYDTTVRMPIDSQFIRSFPTPVRFLEAFVVVVVF